MAPQVSAFQPPADFCCTLVRHLVLCRPHASVLPDLHVYSSDVSFRKNYSGFYGGDLYESYDKRANR